MIHFYYLKLFQGEWTIFRLYLYLKLRFPYNKEKLNSHISGYTYFQIIFRIKTKDEDYSLLTYLASGNKALTLCNSSSLSKVIISTFFLAAYLMKEFCLHGLAQMILEGSTPKSNTFMISAYNMERKNINFMSFNLVIK